MSTTYFSSARNYLKRHPVSNASTMLGPNTSQYSGYIFQRTTTVPHNLGFVPFCRVFYEPFGNGVVMPIISSPLQQKANNIFPGGTNNGPGLIYWTDSTNLYIKLYYSDASLANNSYPIYWVIYEDFKIA